MFAAVPTDRSKHQVPTKHTTFPVFDIWLHVAPQDETCRYCYNLFRKLLPGIVFSPGDLVHVYSIVRLLYVSTNRGKS